MNVLKKLFSKDQKLNIDFCENNLDRFYSEVDFSDFTIFLNGKNINYKEYSCQSKCKECKKSPYAIVNGDFISAESPAALLEKMKKLVISK